MDAPLRHDPRQTAPARPGRTSRAGFATRRQRARVNAAVRAAARTTAPLSAAQRSRDPLADARQHRVPRWVAALLTVLGSLGVHAAIVAIGFLTGGMQKGQREIVEQKIAIQVRETPPPPVLPPEPPQVEKPEKPAPPPKVAKAPPPKAPPVPEPEPSKTPPPRIVGLSMESTAEGGTGPAFAVGNTRAGKTADRAVAPTEVPAQAPGGDPAPGENKVASRLPSAGVTYVKPVRKRMANLASLYPPTLKIQGVEADVKVSLNIDVTGKVTAVKILTPSTYPEFNDAAKIAGMSEAYEPATRDGVPMPYSLPFTYRFRLEDE
jgi:protein TonB